MSKGGHYGLWFENDLLLATATYKNGYYGLNECRPLSRDMLMKTTPFAINLKRWVDR